jgi:hypothetical protein
MGAPSLEVHPSASPADRQSCPCGIDDRLEVSLNEKFIAERAHTRAVRPPDSLLRPHRAPTQTLNLGQLSQCHTGALLGLDHRRVALTYRDHHLRGHVDHPSLAL